MTGRSIDEVRDHLERLMNEQVESLERQAFVGLTPDEEKRQALRLKQIREVSAELLAELKRSA